MECNVPPYAPAVFSYAVYAVLLIVAVLFLPEGVAPALATPWKRTLERAFARKGRMEK